MHWYGNEDQKDAVKEAVKDLDKKYFEAKHLQDRVDLNNMEIGSCLAYIAQETDLIEIYKDTNRRKLYVKNE